MKVAPRFVRQAMVKEIAEHGQLALQASALAVDASSPSGSVARLYGCAAGVQVKEVASLGERAGDCGYMFSHAAAEAVGQGALIVLEHIRATVIGSP